MNRIHRIVWYASRGLWQVVSEISAAQRRAGAAPVAAAGRVIAAGSLLLGRGVAAGRLSGTQVVAGEARTGVGGNQLVIGQGKAAAAKQGIRAPACPVRRPELWEVTVQAHARRSAWGEAGGR